MSDQKSSDFDTKPSFQAAAQAYYQPDSQNQSYTQPDSQSDKSAYYAGSTAAAHSTCHSDSSQGSTYYGNFEYVSSGTNKQGNHYCTRDYGPSAPNQNSYHYSNRNGSYYYNNPDGSTYYNSGRGYSWYNPPK